MTGRPENSSGICALCGGKLCAGEATIPFVRGERIYTIRRVPALICSECTEAYMTGPVVNRIEELLNQLEGLGAEVLVAHYRAA